MFDWNTASYDQKYAAWQQLRKNIEGLNVENTLIHLSVFFKTIKCGKRTIDYYTPSSWPSPWEIIDDKHICKSAVTVLIYNTIKLSSTSINMDDVKLLVVQDAHDMYLTICIGDDLLNYRNGDIIKLSPEIFIVETIAI